MRLEELKPVKGATKKAKRVGRGVGSGSGKTSGKGHKGQKARSGGVKGAGFEGGQMPLHRRIPKRGFSNAPFGKEHTTVNVSDLVRFEKDAKVGPQEIVASGLARKIAKHGLRALVHHSGSPGVVTCHRSGVVTSLSQGM